MFNPTELAAIDGLRGELRGDLHAPGDADWDVARGAWNLAVDQRPELVAIPADSDDVIRLVEAAREAGLRICVQGTGHNAAAHPHLEGTLLISTARINQVTIDADARRARVGAGAIWSEVVVPAAEHGLAALQGSAHDVGVVGYSLGGGVSFLGRKYGLAAEQISEATIVTADGVLRRVDAEHGPDLFWALRGGGGNYGVVTEIAIELLPLERIYAGGLFFPFERGREVLQAWREWTAQTPEEMTSVGRLLQFPPIPDIPEPMRGNSYALIEAFYLGSEAEGEALLAPLRELGPSMDTVAPIGFEQLMEVHMDPPEPVPYLCDHQLLSHLDANAIDRLIDAVGSDSALLSLEIRQMGGALGRHAEGCGALGAIEGEFMSFGVGMLPGPEAEPALRESLARARAALTPVDAGAQYLNFTEYPVDPETLYGAEKLARLREVKRRYDAGGLFRGNHPIEAG